MVRFPVAREGGGPGVAPRRGQGCESYENVQLWLANNEKVGYTDLSHMLQYVHGSGGSLCRRVLFWQIRQSGAWVPGSLLHACSPSELPGADGCLML